MAAILEKSKLEGFVPHRSRMFLLDRILDQDTDGWKATSQTDITENFMFYDKSVGGAPNYSLFECAAQTAAAITGLYAVAHGIPLRPGFVLTVSGMKFSVPAVEVGKTVTVQAERTDAIGPMYSFTAHLFTSDTKAGFNAPRTEIGSLKLTIYDSAVAETMGGEE